MAEMYINSSHFVTVLSLLPLPLFLLPLFRFPLRLLSVTFHFPILRVRSFSQFPFLFYRNFHTDLPIIMNYLTYVSLSISRFLLFLLLYMIPRHLRYPEPCRIIQFAGLTEVTVIIT